MKSYSFALVLFSILSLTACRQKESESSQLKLFSLVSSDSTGIHFRNDIRDDETFNIFSYRNFYNGGGVATGDINNDGLPDVFFTANMGANKLYLNKGNLQFEDISAKAGIEESNKWSTGVVMADVNADGWLDIYVCNAGYEKGLNTHNALFINNHDGTFTDSARAYGLDNDGYSTHAAFFDYDLDGDLDCYILNNSFIPVNTLNYSNKRELRAKDWPVKDYLKGGGSYLMRNDNGHYTDVSESAGIYGSLISFGLGVTVGDVNGDLYPDIYVSNDFFEKDYLYINQRNGSFRESLEEWTEHISQSSMGADMADVNNDGYPDLFVTDMLPREDARLKTTTSFENYDVYQLKVNQGFYHQYMQNTLQVNNRNGKFMEVAHHSGVAASDWSWGGLIFDADNDGLNDLYVCNGISRDLTDQDFIDFFADDIIQRMVTTGSKDKVQEVINKMPQTPIRNKAFRNKGNLDFEDAGDQWGFTQPSFSNGASFADLDNDGDLDLLVSNVNVEAFFFRNNSPKDSAHHSLRIQLKGRYPNTYAIGSTIRVYAGSEVLTRELIPSRGFQSSIDYTQVIGLGERTVDSICIIWPDRTYTKLEQPNTNNDIKAAWPVNAPVYRPYEPPAQPMLQIVKGPFEKHAEDNYVDFYMERNMPVMISREGPRAAVADVNGDGLDDVYVGGAAGQAGQLYLQQQAGGFAKITTPDFDLMAQFEDVAVLFFDADGDNDMDLFVGSGGNHLQPFMREMQNRLYRNDSKGHFTLDAAALPENAGNSSAVVAFDYDNDKDQDLFVGSICMPQQFGAPPAHYLLQNNGKGKFTDVTESVFPAASTLGFITAAKATRFAKNGNPDLVIVGEWMAPRIFGLQNGKMQEVKTNLQHYPGWWQSLAVADLDGDGDMDMVLGNMGTNCYLKPDSAHPLKLWYADFDGNNRFDQVLTRRVDNKDVPVFLKRDLTDQLPGLKKQNLRFEAYATRSIEELFNPKQLANARKYEFSYPYSCIAYNNGDGNFSVTPLPSMVQLSSVHAIDVTDLNHDGRADLLLGGNQLAMLPQFGRLDASFGHVLIGNPAGGFDWLEPRLSGVQMEGAIRDIQTVNGPKTGYLFLRNNSTPMFYTIATKQLP